ncbi:ankyrin repeat-containing yar1 [Trichoderma arundinaceum]|uniref:Ankyrin repeat-containing yar1 n=1 Tax=Trichoderma arundinaceum TaxID=490622 RepID=A0A395NTW8_TRIAR|nr:ankyrin repeat-containing yar1 [Trichoderma arundinaceum]
MAPNLTEDEIDDLVYFARVGEDGDLSETLTALSEREKVSPAEILLAAKDEGKSTPLHMAAGNGHLGTAMKQSRCQRQRSDGERLTRHPETVRKLIQYFDERPKEEKQTFLDDANEHGNTGLHWAALGGHLDTVTLLVERGASPALANEQNYVPLDLAYFNEHNDVAQFFLASAGMLEEKNQESGLNGAVESVKLDEGENGVEENKASAS